jgi:hypothetical protein
MIALVKLFTWLFICLTVLSFFYLDYNLFFLLFWLFKIIFWFAFLKSLFFLFLCDFTLRFVLILFISIFYIYLVFNMNIIQRNLLNFIYFRRPIFKYDALYRLFLHFYIIFFFLFAFWMRFFNYLFTFTFESVRRTVNLSYLFSYWLLTNNFESWHQFYCITFYFLTNKHQLGNIYDRNTKIREE